MDMNNDYGVCFEIAGPTAMFTRPDTGSTPVSYPVPTWSAAKAMFEAVAWVPHAFVEPMRVEICRPTRYERYVTNYHGPLRKPGKDTYQLAAMILVDVCYRIYGEVRVKESSTRGKGEEHLRTGCPIPDPWQGGDEGKDGLTRRLAVSCLVDADHGDTALHYGGEVEEEPRDAKWAERLNSLHEYVAHLPRGSDDRTTKRNELRQRGAASVVPTNTETSSCGIFG
jgi:CRISPR-associated Cas5-like protein